MVAIIAALAATLYITGTVVWSLAFFSTFDDRFIQSAPRYKLVTETVTSGFAENPFHVMVIKFIFMVMTKAFGGFRYSLAHLAYYIDILNTIAAFAVFWEQIQSKSYYEKELTTRFANDNTGIPDITSLKQIKRLIHPVLKNDGIIIHPHITYATREEALDAIKQTNDYNQPRKMMLDVYTAVEKPPGLRPVLIHIHGGAWRMGSKNHLYPYENDLITEEKWVVVNIAYRLAPINAYPTHLKDVKRAIRWVKQCINNFGGDPNFIVLAGDSAGGHLAMMAAMTANQSQYQEGFEDVDTSVQGVITLNGALRIHHDMFFAKKVALMKEPINRAFLLDHSPVTYCEKAHQLGNLVPSLIIIGQRDALVNPDGGREFAQQYRRASGKENEPTAGCSLVEIPGGHHVFYAGWSPRTLFLNSIILSWCRDLHNKNK